MSVRDPIVVGAHATEAALLVAAVSSILSVLVPLSSQYVVIVSRNSTALVSFLGTSSLAMVCLDSQQSTYQLEHIQPQRVLSQSDLL